jgi:LacI family transcriptional regulator
MKESAAMVTLQDIARRTGVTPKTVSNVLAKRNKEVRRGAIERADRIRMVAKEMGYLPNASAVSMVSGRFRALGLVLSTHASEASISSGTTWAIQEEMLRKQMHLVVGQVFDRKLTDEASLPRLLREWLVDGLLISYTSRIPQALPTLLSESRIPTVWLNVRRDSDSVYPDDTGGLYLATTTLLEQGHRRIAYVKEGQGSHYSCADRRSGYLQAVSEAGITPNIPDIPKGDALASITQLLRGPDSPSAVVTYSATEASITLLAAAHAGKRVPEDLSIIATSENSTEISGVRFSVVEIPVYDVGRVGVEMLLDKIENPGVALPGRPLQFRLVEQQTHAPFRRA